MLVWSWGLRAPTCPSAGLPSWRAGKQFAWCPCWASLHRGAQNSAGLTHLSHNYTTQRSLSLHIQRGKMWWMQAAFVTDALLQTLRKLNESRVCLGQLRKEYFRHHPCSTCWGKLSPKKCKAVAYYIKKKIGEGTGSLNRLTDQKHSPPCLILAITPAAGNTGVSWDCSNYMVFFPVTSIEWKYMHAGKQLVIWTEVAGLSLVPAWIDS